MLMMKKEIPWEAIIQKLKGQTNPDIDDFLDSWLEDEENAALFRELQALWRQIQQDSVSYTPDTSFYWKELSRRMEGCEKQTANVSRRRTLGTRLAVAACVTVLAVLSFLVGKGTVGHDGHYPLSYSNLRGKSKALLPDRSIVWLHGETELSCDITYAGGDERVVRMEGEAYFDVESDKERPFVVETEGMKIVVHGTKFNVEAFPDSENVYVSLVEGSVSVETSTECCMLKPGEVATYDKQAGKLSVAAGDVLFASSWTRDEITFNQQTLREICRFLCKWYGVKIDVSPEIADTYRYTFVLHNESLEEILRLMAHINPMWYSFSSENELMIYQVEK